MAFADTPAPHGATKINFRQTTPYVYQAYPSTRNHPDGRSVEVKSAEEDAALGPEWRDTPYPPKPIAVPVPEPTMAELKARIIELEKQNGDLRHSNADMTLSIQQSAAKENKKSGKKAETAA